MNFSKILIYCLTSLLLGQQKQFVSIIEDGIKVNRQEGVIHVTIPFKILKGYHIQALSETQDNLIPTEIAFENPYRCEVLKHEFINVHYDTVVLNKIEHRVLSKAFEVKITLNCDKRDEQGSSKLNGKLYYQTCDDRQCFFPRTLNFSVTF